MSNEELEKSEQLRRRILDATLACYVEYGWSGTNMSIIARHVGMTRGMIQYYFPTLEDVLHASISHLNGEWQKKYFAYIQDESDGSDRLEVGIKALWRLMQDPLHIARQEVLAAARSDAKLRAVMQQEAGFDEASTLDRAKKTYPDLAQGHEMAFRSALDFTVIFLEGLSRHQFSSDAESRTQALLEMLKSSLAGYWHANGVELSEGTSATAAPTPAPRPHTRATHAPVSGDRDRRALAFILKAAAILSEPGDAPDDG
jgi:AcrR family transcriptional regulator